MTDEKPHAYIKFWCQARMRAGFSQLELSKKLRLTSSQFVSNVERGISRYSLRQVARLIQILKLNPERVVRLLASQQEADLRRALTTDKKICGSE